MAIEKMAMIQITGNLSCLDEALLRCLKSGELHPEQISGLAGNIHGFTSVSGENPYAPLMEDIKEIALRLKIDLNAPAKGARQETLADPRLEAPEYLEQLRDRAEKLSAERAGQQTAAEHCESVLRQIEHLRTLNADMDEIFACKHIEVRFGRLPAESWRKLNYYSDRLFIFLSLSEEKGYNWGAYFTTRENRAEVDYIFSSLYFERMWIPETVHGTPESAKAAITESMENSQARLSELDREIRELAENNREKLYSIYSAISFYNESFELRKYVMSQGSKFYLIGFAPKRECGKLQELLGDLPGTEVEIKPPDSDKHLKIPTKLRNNFITRPFEMFTEMYGTPEYGEIDPTPVLALTYMLLFGIMFGDLGQGLVISLLGFLLWRFKRMLFGKILIRIGISSAIFGIVYGSVFGLEHLLNPLYKTVLGLSHKPIEVLNPTTINGILITAIVLGVGLILMSMLINIYARAKARDWENLFFSSSGAAGLLFYGSVLAGAAVMLTGGASLFTAPYVICLIVLPLLLMFLKPRLGRVLRRDAAPEEKEGIGSFIIEGFFELFEVVLSFITNTMSFLRVGGFVISHAGMMAVVLMLTEMMSGAGSAAVLIFGNIFVMGIEGFVVGIQALRLEFYEMFSRYFSGQGKSFSAIKRENE